MSVEDKNIIDIVSLDKNDTALLTISDHLEWDIDNEHLLILQDKINAYLNAIESGELYRIYPKAENKIISIRIVALQKPSGDGFLFLKNVKEILETAGYIFQFEQRSI